VIAAVLLVPFAAMQFSNDVDWTTFDFILVGVLLAGVGAAYELAAARGSGFYRAGAAFALAAALMLFLASGAVGVIAAEDDPANMLFVGLIAFTALGAAVSRAQASGLARVTCAAAGLQVLIGAAALLAGWGQEAHLYPWDIVGATGFFAALWLVAAGLFARAGKA
jgi:hypothetical protein